MLPCKYEEDKNKIPMNKPYNIQNTNICNGIYQISFFKALLISLVGQHWRTLLQNLMNACVRQYLDELFSENRTFSDTPDVQYVRKSALEL
jgi:hypothetical protein